MGLETIGCPHCGEQTEVPVQNGQQITEIKEERSFFDALLVLQGVEVMTVECPSGHAFCVYQE